VKWYAVRVRGAWEAKVRDGLNTGGIETYLPARRETVRWSDREICIERPLFPGYLFARFERRDQRILGVTGTLQILGHEEDSISDEVISSIRILAESPAPVSLCPYEAGFRVRVKNGPFAGCVGIIRRRKGSTRLVVSIPMLNQAVAVELDRRDVKPESQ
jgi:transcription antitermination factor NusG